MPTRREAPKMNHKVHRKVHHKTSRECTQKRPVGSLRAHTAHTSTQQYASPTHVRITPRTHHPRSRHGPPSSSRPRRASTANPPPPAPFRISRPLSHLIEMVCRNEITADPQVPLSEGHGNFVCIRRELISHQDHYVHMCARRGSASPAFGGKGTPLGFSVCIRGALANA